MGYPLLPLAILDGDGVIDLAVGAANDDTGFGETGAVYVLLMNSSGTVKGVQKIAHLTGGGPSLSGGDRFGSEVSALGDLDADGVVDLAVGATGDNGHGAVHVLLLNPDGTVKSSQKIGHNTGGGPNLAAADAFGTSISLLGDLNGDGVTEIAVGADGDDTGGPNTNRGAVYVLFLNPTGTVRQSTEDRSSNGWWSDFGG